MQVRSDAILDLTPLLAHGAYSAPEAQGEGLLEPSAELLEADGLRVAGPLEWNVSVFSSGGEGEFVLEGSVKGVTVAECRRCLTDVETEVEAAFVYPMLYKPSDKPPHLDEVSAEDDDDTLIFGQPEIDLAAFITEMLAIEQPVTVLCKEACLGLNEDGVNLNEHPELARKEDREQPRRRSPFEALRDVDLNQKG